MHLIQKITSSETYLVRHPVLRKGKPITSCQFNDDDLETTLHFGLYLNQELTGVLSLYEKSNTVFPEKNQCQIRGMAILENRRKKGFGEALIIHCEKHCISKNVNLIWFNARIQAVGFYEKLGYAKKGNPFEIENIGEHVLMFKKLQPTNSIFNL